MNEKKRRVKYILYDLIYNTSVWYPLSRSIPRIFRKVYYGNEDDGRKTGPQYDEEEDRSGREKKIRGLIHGVKYTK